MTSKDDGDDPDVLADAFKEGFRHIFGEDMPDELPRGFHEKSLSTIFEINQLEKDLGLPNGFFEGILDDGDWEFIIKLHALFEATVTHLLIQHFDDPSLDQIMQRLEMSNFQTGKIGFARALGLVDRDIVRYIQKLSEIRNAFVHNVSNVNIGLKEYLDGLPEGKSKGMKKGFFLGYRLGEALDLKPEEGFVKRKPLMQLFCVPLYEHVPQLSIWIGALHCLSLIQNRIAIVKLGRHESEMVSQQAKLFRRYFGVSALDGDGAP